MDSNSILYKQSTVYYRIIGKGKPVVLIHGFAEDGEVWHNQTGFLKDHYQLIIPDLPGSGLSSLNNQLSAIDDYAEVIKAILDNEKITSCIVIGHSMGGYITLALAEKYPQLLKAFGLFHSTAFADSEEKKQVRLKAIDLIKLKGADTFIKATTYNLFANPFKTTHADEINSLIEKGKNCSAEALIQYYHAMINRPDRTSILRKTTNPVLFIIGEHDNAVPLQNSLQQCHLSSQSYISILSNSAHMGMWEETAKANKILIDFLNYFNK